MNLNKTKKKQMKEIQSPTNQPRKKGPESSQWITSAHVRLSITGKKLKTKKITEKLNMKYLKIKHQGLREKR
jgi:hypothetical protein